MAVELKKETKSEESAIVARPRELWLSTREFFRDTAAEMKKVSWPGRTEVVGTTMVVIVATLIFATYLWGCDWVFTKATLWLFQKTGVNV